MKKTITFLFVVCALVVTLILPLGTMNYISAGGALHYVIVNDGTTSRQVLTGARTVAELMHELGITLDSTIRIDYTQEALITNGMAITIEREMNYVVEIDGTTMGKKAGWPNTTVEQILLMLQNEKDVALLYDGDYNRQIIYGETLNLTTLTARKETEIVTMYYETYENLTPHVWEGHSYVRQTGSPGEKEVTTTIIYIGGVEQNREVTNRVVIEEPVNSIIDIGQGRLGALADVTAPDFHYVRRVRMEATAYTAGFSCTGKHPWDPWYRITASGREVEHGIVAVDRRVIPLGTRLYVEGYGFALAADVGGAIRGYKIDLFMEELQDALRFGRRHLYVWILE